MKKSVIFLIAVIYIVSIVVVTFFGSQIAIDQFEIYMTKIEITNYDYIKDGNKYIEFKFDEVEDDELASIYLDYDYSPDNATHPEQVTFKITNNEITNIEGEKEEIAGVTKSGEVWFKQKRTVRVTIYTTDGSALSDTIIIICR